MSELENNISLGQYLRKEREKRGLTIEQVASATKIGVRQLHALEGDQYSELPAKPFIRGFVTSYSRFVGLDYKEVLTHFNSFIDSKVHERPNRESGHSGYAFEKREGSEQSRMVLGIVMGSFIVVGGIVMVFLKPSLHHHHHSHADKLRAAHSGSPVPDGSPGMDSAAAVLAQMSPSPLVIPSANAIAVSASPSAFVEIAQTQASPPVSRDTKDLKETKEAGAPLVTTTAAAPVTTAPAGAGFLAAAPTPSPTSASDPLNSGLGLKPTETKERLVVKAKENIWVRYKVDDKMVMQFPLKKDKVLVLRGRQSIILQLSDPASATISHNGQGYQSGASFSSIARQDQATLFFPRQAAEKIENPFPGTKRLPAPKAPASVNSQPTPSTT